MKFIIVHVDASYVIPNKLAPFKD